MKKALIAVLTLSCFSFVSCDKPNNDDYILVCDANKNCLFNIVYESKETTESTKIIEEFVERLEEKCGVEFSVLDSNQPDKSNEILIGNIADRDNSLYYNLSSMPTTYTISYENEDIVVY